VINTDIIIISCVSPGDFPYIEGAVDYKRIVETLKSVYSKKKTKLSKTFACKPPANNNRIY